MEEDANPFLEYAVTSDSLNTGPGIPERSVVEVSGSTTGRSLFEVNGSEGPWVITRPSPSFAYFTLGLTTPIVHKTVAFDDADLQPPRIKTVLKMGFVDARRKG